MMSKRGKDKSLEREIKRLNGVIREKDKVIKSLKSEKKQAMDRFTDSEVYLKEVTGSRSLSEIMKTVREGRPLSGNKEPCPSCNNEDMSILLYTGFHLKLCKCGYRKRINEVQEIEKS